MSFLLFFKIIIKNSIMKKNLATGTKKTSQNSKINENATKKITTGAKNQVITKEDVTQKEKNGKKYDFSQDLNVQVRI